MADLVCLDVYSMVVDHDGDDGRDQRLGREDVEITAAGKEG